MPTKTAHSALIDRLRAMTKVAENESEKKVKTQHPSGSDSADDDQTQDTAVGARYQEQTEENREMYPKGTASDTKNEEGTQESDPGHNRGVKVRASGEIPEVDRKHLLNDPQDPGSGHPSGTAKVSAVEEARKLSADLREVVGQLAKLAEDNMSEDTSDGGGSSEEFLSGGETGEPAPPKGHEENQSGSSEFPAGDASQVSVTKGEASDPGEKTSAKKGADEAEKLAALRKEQELATRELIEGIHKSADFDAEFFTSFLGEVVDKLSPQKPTQKVAEDEGSESDNKKEDKSESSDSSSESKSSPEPSESSNEPSSPESSGSDQVPAEPSQPAPDEGGGDSALAEMAGLNTAPPAEGAAPPEAAMMGGGDPAMMGGGDPAMMGGESGLTPEEEALLLQALMGQGMDEASIMDYAKMGKALSKGTKLSAARESYFQELDTRVKKAQEIVRNTKAASTLANELNLIGKGI